MGLAFEAGELVGGDELDDGGEALSEFFFPFFRRQGPFVAKVDDFSTGGDAEANFDVFHEGLLGETAGLAEGVAAEDDCLIAKGDATEDEAEFVKDFDDEGFEGVLIEALAEYEHAGVGVLGDGF